jgi:hypothetical protein
MNPMSGNWRDVSGKKNLEATECKPKKINNDQSWAWSNLAASEDK